jgi:hypothetical protein
LEASNFVTGLRTVTGVRAAKEEGVEVVATVQQSNWPALIKEGRSMVRAASNEHKQVWKESVGGAGRGVLKGGFGRGEVGDTRRGGSTGCEQRAHAGGAEGGGM